MFALRGGDRSQDRQLAQHFGGRSIAGIPVSGHPGFDRLSVFCAAEETDVGIRVPLDQSLTNARAIIDAARGWLPTLMIGPIPVIEDMQPYVFPNGIAYHYTNARIAELNTSLANLCGELGVPYLDIFDALAADPAWDASQRGCDGVHATGDGYQLIADRIGDWPAWRAWFSD